MLFGSQTVQNVVEQKTNKQSFIDFWPFFQCVTHWKQLCDFWFLANLSIYYLYCLPHSGSPIPAAIGREASYTLDWGQSVAGLTYGQFREASLTEQALLIVCGRKPRDRIFAQGNHANPTQKKPWPTEEPSCCEAKVPCTTVENHWFKISEVNN